MNTGRQGDDRHVVRWKLLSPRDSFAVDEHFGPSRWLTPNAACYRLNHGTAGLDLKILKRQPLGLSFLCGNKPKSSLTSEMQAPQRTHVGATQDGGGERNLTSDPINWLKL